LHVGIEERVSSIRSWSDPAVERFAEECQQDLVVILVEFVED
jgi:hypothetical protein